MRLVHERHGDADAAAVRVTQRAAHAHVEAAGQSHIHTKTEVERDAAVAVPEGRNHGRHQVGHEAGVGAFELDPPADGEADRDGEQRVAVAEESAQAEGQRAVVEIASVT